jgi:hypothetical protein
MSYKTVEVELKNGRVSPVGSEALPSHARALLTILSSDRSPQAAAPNGSLADLVADLAGIGRGEHTDLSTNRSHLDDFGR